jgi:hypothetical protein
MARAPALLVELQAPSLGALARERIAALMREILDTAPTQDDTAAALTLKAVYFFYAYSADNKQPPNKNLDEFKKRIKMLPSMGQSEVARSLMEFILRQRRIKDNALLYTLHTLRETEDGLSMALLLTVIRKDPAYASLIDDWTSHVDQQSESIIPILVAMTFDQEDSYRELPLDALSSMKNPKAILAIIKQLEQTSDWEPYPDVMMRVGTTDNAKAQCYHHLYRLAHAMRRFPEHDPSFQDILRSAAKLDKTGELSRQALDLKNQAVWPAAKAILKANGQRMPIGKPSAWQFVVGGFIAVAFIALFTFGTYKKHRASKESHPKSSGSDDGNASRLRNG